MPIPLSSNVNTTFFSLTLILTLILPLCSVYLIELDNKFKTTFQSYLDHTLYNALPHLYQIQ